MGVNVWPTHDVVAADVRVSDHESPTPLKQPIGLVLSRLRESGLVKGKIVQHCGGSNKFYEILRCEYFKRGHRRRKALTNVDAVRVECQLQHSERPSRG